MGPMAEFLEGDLVRLGLILAIVEPIFYIYGKESGNGTRVD